MNKEKSKKVVIKIYKNGQIEVAAKDPGVAILIQYPDESEIELQVNDKKIWEDGKEYGGK